ncbi:MAG: S-methyl-5'-thioinosine phosphorylase [Pseudomonadota bacterium]
MSAVLAIIGGSAPPPGAGDWPAIEVPESRYGVHSGPIRRIELTANASAYYLPRHDESRHIAPHRVNYRANVDVLSQLGVTHVLLSYAVGALVASLPPEALVLPDQIIDYSYGREHTFHDGDAVEHLEFAEPFDAGLRVALAVAAKDLGESVVAEGCYACTQGPRLETAAEVRRLAADGGTLVGMTAMPEVALLKERGITAAALCLVINPAAGVVPGAVDMEELYRVAERGSRRAQAVLLRAVERFQG